MLSHYISYILSESHTYEIYIYKRLMSPHIKLCASTDKDAPFKITKQMENSQTESDLTLQ